MTMSTAETPKLTPMFEQYLQIKEEYADCLLFYRMGDFYELFFEDAEVAARDLQIALTSRSSPNADYRIPMCGVPYHAAETYLPQLLEKGHKVAICEQVEDPRAAKGLVKRAVMRVLTPGTVVEDANLHAKGHNFLAAALWDENTGAGGLAWMDYSTGDWSGLAVSREAELWQWAQKMAPRELLLPDTMTPPESFSPDTTQVNRLPLRPSFDLGGATTRILATQNVANLTVLGLEKHKELTRACGALLVYLAQTQKQDLTHLGQFRLLNLGKHLILDEITERNLEIFRRLDGRRGPGTLWSVLDNTLTPMGGRLLEERLRHPWRELGPITETQNAVEFFASRDGLRTEFRTALRDVYDIERLSTRIQLNRATPKDFVALRNSLAMLPNLRGVLETAGTSTPEHDVAWPSAVLETKDFEGTAPSPEQATPPAFLRTLLTGWDDMADYHAMLDSALVDNPPHLLTEGGLFKYGFHSDLDELIDLTEHGESRLEELLAEEQRASGILKMKLKYNRVFGYFFDVPNSSTQAVPEHFIRRQTLANAERYTTPRLKELEEKLLAASDRRKSLEYRLFQQLRESLAEARPRILFMADVLAGLDYWQSLAECARKWNWARPEVHTGQDIQITEGRHPVVEAVQGGSRFIPNDLRMDDQRRILLITGPNMAGKSTVLRQAAIICILAQIGSFVPARQARIGVADRIFSRVGASDNLAQGQSTFMVEMMETARILRQAGKRSLVILDEIGRGTSTFDGLSLAWAVVEELARRQDGIRTLFATHYHELTALEGNIPGVHNMNIAIREWNGDIVFLRRLVPGPSDRSYGIEVAKLAGVPVSVVRRAKEILEDLERKAKASGTHPHSIRVAQSSLPGMPEVAPQPEQEHHTEQAAPRVDHPLLVALRDLNTNTMTPLEALNRLTEWKMLWGESPDKD